MLASLFHSLDFPISAWWFDGLGYTPKSPKCIGTCGPPILCFKKAPIWNLSQTNFLLSTIASQKTKSNKHIPYGTPKRKLPHQISSKTDRPLALLSLSLSLPAIGAYGTFIAMVSISAQLKPLNHFWDLMFPMPRRSRWPPGNHPPETEQRSKSYGMLGLPVRWFAI